MKTFQTIKTDELLETVGLTIKKDNINKLITFLCQLATYSDDSQFNISFNAPSSAGKSFIPMEEDCPGSNPAPRRLRRGFSP